MSRIGKRPVPLPAGVNVTIRDSQIVVKGPKGELKRAVPTTLAPRLEGGQVVIERKGDGRQLNVALSK